MADEKITVKWWPEEPILPPTAKRMDAILSDAWAEYQRVKKHRDEMVENVRRRKRIAAEQEAIIQRLAAERKQLREDNDALRADDVLPLPLDKYGERIHVGDHARYMGATFEVVGVSFAMETRDFAPVGYSWRVKLGTRDGEKVKPGYYDVQDHVVEVVCEVEDSMEAVFEDAFDYMQRRQFKGTQGDRETMRGFVERIKKLESES